jgi:hypothetical protein
MIKPTNPIFTFLYKQFRQLPNIHLPSPTVASTVLYNEYNALLTTSGEFLSHEVHKHLYPLPHLIEYNIKIKHVMVSFMTTPTAAKSVIKHTLYIIELLIGLYPRHMAAFNELNICWIPLALHKQLTDSQVQELARNIKHNQPQSIHTNTTNPISKTTQNENQITPNNVNSAFTNITPLRRLIIVYRKEDALKTLIHEVIHGLDLDGNKMIKSRMYETITELSAFIIHIAIYCYKNSTSYDEYMLYIEAVLYMELQHAHQQATKVYYLNAGNTNALHYYVYKYQILSHWDEYMKWAKHNTEYWFNVIGDYDGLNDIIHKPFIPAKLRITNTPSHKSSIKNMRLMYIE